jgi:hypothetical protein
MANRTGKGWFVKGRRSANPAGRPKNPVIPPPPPGYAPEPAAADRRPIRNLVIEARKFSGLAVDTLVELTKDSHADSTRYNAATALLDRGYGRPAQSLDLHLSADAITKRLSDKTDAELAALELPPHRLCWRQPRKCRTMHVSWRTVTSRIPRRMPLRDSTLTQHSPRLSLGV